MTRIVLRSVLSGNIAKKLVVCYKVSIRSSYFGWRVRKRQLGSHVLLGDTAREEESNAACSGNTAALSEEIASQNHGLVQAGPALR